VAGRRLSDRKSACAHIITILAFAITVTVFAAIGCREAQQEEQRKSRVLQDHN
jgi:hypothetical protein